MERSEKVHDAVRRAIEELNETWPELGLGSTPDTLLIGTDAVLDSTSIVELMIAVEQNLQDDLGEEIAVMDIIADRKPERWTVRDLTTSIEEQLACAAKQ